VNGRPVRGKGPYNPGVAEPTYAIRDLGAERVVDLEGTEYRTHCGERVVRMLIARKGPRRTPLYFAFKESRGRHFLERLFCSSTAGGTAR